MKKILLSLALTLTLASAPATALAYGLLCDGACYATVEECIEAACGSGECSHTCDTSCGSASDEACPPPDTSEESAGGAQPAALHNPLGTNDIPTLVGRATSIFVGISGSFALLMFVYGGILWLTSGGSQEKITKGKKVFTWAVVGLIVIFGGYAMLKALFSAIGA